jgi:cell wall-associated NlpC family hydrolase
MFVTNKVQSSQVQANKSSAGHTGKAAEVFSSSRSAGKINLSGQHLNSAEMLKSMLSQLLGSSHRNGNASQHQVDSQPINANSNHGNKGRGHAPIPRQTPHVPTRPPVQPTPAAPVAEPTPAAPVTPVAEPSPETTPAGVTKLIDAATAQQGAKYVFGAQGNGKFDCSGLVHFALNEAGLNDQRTNARGYQERYKDTQVSREDLKPGDLVFYWSPNDRGIPKGRATHIEIYLGDGMTMGASPKTGSSIKPLNEGTFIGGARVPELQNSAV